MDRSDPLEQAVTRLQRRYRFLRRLRRSLDTALVGLAAVCLATALAAAGAWTAPLPPVYALLALAALFVLLCLSWPGRAAPLDMLAAADHTLRSRERLSTAYEYATRHAGHPFNDALMAEADRLAPRVEPRQVLPLRLPRRSWAIPALLAASLALHGVETPTWSFDTLGDADFSRQMARQGQRLEQWGHDLERLARQEHLDRSLVLARQLQNLGKHLQDEHAPQDAFTDRIATLSDYLRRLREELRERALMSGMGPLAVRDTLPSGKSLKQELQDVLKLLQDEAPPRDRVAAAEQSLQRLRQQAGGRPVPELESLLQNLRAGDVQAARQLLREVIEQQQAGEELQHLERARRVLEYASRSLRQQAEGQPGGDPAPGARQAQSDFDPRNLGDEFMMEDLYGMEEFSAPGSDAGYGVSARVDARPEQALRESEQPMSHVELQNSPGPTRLHYLRRLPMVNEARVPVEQVAVQYQQAAEEVLTHEDIPRGYREQIKQYFLSLGMVQE
jgi:hypothetical protein